MWTSAAIFILAFAGCQGSSSTLEGLAYTFCGEDETISQVKSDYNGTDRYWTLGCQKFPSRLFGCRWSGFFHAYDKEIHFNCEANYVINSVFSTYNDDHEDREWNFLCCTADKLVTYDCGESPKVNFFKENFEWNVAGSNYLTGMRSYGSNNYGDHRWAFSYCRAAVLDSEMLNSQILKVNSLLGSQLTEGDIVTTLSRTAVNDAGLKWTKSNGQVPIPYAIQSSFSSSDKAAIQSAMSGIHQSTCVRFVPVSGQADYVSIESNEGCWSYVGRIGGVQRLSLGAGCLGVNTVQHELIHAIGFWHEHSRTDRDLYVKIHWDNIQEQHVQNFQKKDTNNLNVPYDLLSLMHYGPTAFTRNGENTITPLEMSAQTAQGIGMSEKDVLKINKLYGCTDYLHKNGLWDNNLKESLSKQCPSGQAVSSITSSRDESSVDRLWGITCKPFVETKACYWSSYVNELWEYMDFKCSDNQVIAGVHSTYNSVLTDRQWKFLCCHKPDFSLTDCKDEPVINYWDEHFNWKVAGNNYLTGVKSSFDSATKDRRWSFTYCQKKQQ